MLPQFQGDDRLLDDFQSTEADRRLLNHIERHVLVCAWGSIVRINYRDELRVLLILAASAQHP